MPFAEQGKQATEHTSRRRKDKLTTGKDVQERGHAWTACHVLPGDLVVLLRRQG